MGTGRRSYVLNAATDVAGKSQTITRQLPRWYLPQALGHMLPRLLPLHEAKTYMFATYVSSEKEVLTRYVSVEPPQAVVLGGQSVRAVPIRDRITLEGTPTIHYFSPEGQYLGSVTDATQTTLLASDESELKNIWKTDRLITADDFDHIGPAPAARK